ncbi:uncharacterized protein LOC123314185 [Coccinella septempunctata]|uniref:uncharacterized protein LOC123314185 n=1 Tax=Coccinella septempunctata TaxID=41139 RepID=UPI001D08BCAA|nr:uncharacterized protein LOC123314185 [Coccinella septempunctata]
MSNLRLVVFFALSAVLVVRSEINVGSTSDHSETKNTLHKDCSNAYTPTCLKLDIVSWVDKLNENDDVDLVPGVSVVRENGSEQVNTADIVAELARDFPNDADARLDAFLMKKVTGYLNSHSVRLNLWNQNQVETARRTGGGGGNKNGGGGGGMGGGGMMMAAGAMMKGTLVALALGGLAAIAGKALMTGMISLLLSAIIGLKSLTHGHKSTTYEIVAKPIYSHSNTHSISHDEGHGGYGHSGYSRSYDMPLPLGLHTDYQPK